MGRLVLEDEEQVEAEEEADEQEKQEDNRHREDSMRSIAKGFAEARL